MKIHRLKCWPEHFTPLLLREKKFEIRVNDRNFHSGDKLIMEEYDPISKSYTGRSTTATCGYILKQHAGLKENFVIIQLIL